MDRNNNTNNKHKNVNSIVFDLGYDSNKLKKIHSSKDNSRSDTKIPCSSKNNDNSNTTDNHDSDTTDNDNSDNNSNSL